METETARPQENGVAPPHAAFEALYAASHDDLVRFAVRRVGIDAAADVVSEVYLIAWRRRGDYDPDEARLWLFGVASRVVANHRRANERRSRLGRRMASHALPPAAPDEVGDGVATRADVLAVLALLPHREQEALRLTEWEGLDPREAAAVAGCSAATFRVRLHRARVRFAGLMQEVQR